MKVSKIALAAALALGAVSAVPTQAANAQEGQAQEQPLDLSEGERAAIVPLFTAIEAKNWAAAQAALPAAQAAAQGDEAKYLVAQARLQIGMNANNQQMQAEAIDAMLATNSVPAANLMPLLSNQAALALSANNLEKAEAAFARMVQLDPNDAETVVRLAELKNDRNDKAAAIPLYLRALELREASGEQAPENWYRRALAVAYDAQQIQPAMELSRKLVSAYPSQVNWRDALLIYRDLGNVEGPMNIDLMRLMRAADALNGERDYIELADELNTAGLPGESKAVLEHGISRGMLERGDSNVRELMTLADRRIPDDRASLQRLRTQAEAAAGGRDALDVADAYFGYGDYAAAAELYRLALQKGGVDADLANSRLGMALALAGQRAEAEQAFRAVSGAHQQLAQYWLVWLGQQAG